MKNSKNARGIFAGLGDLPKPDMKSLVAPNIGALVESLGDPPDQSAKPTDKKRAGEAAGIDGLEHLHREPPKRRLFYDLATARRATAALGRLPDPEESFHCLMGGDYHGFDLIIAVRELAGEVIEELHVATLGFNRHNMAHLCSMLDARDVGRAHVLCSEYFAGADFETFGYAKHELGRRGLRCVASRNHAKVLLFAIGPRRFVIESSANLRSCNNLEQFALCQSPPLYEFHRAWIERALNHGG